MFRSKLILAAVMVCFVVMAAQDAAALGECDCSMTPTNMTISRGTNLEFDVTVTNNTDQNGHVMFGGKLTMPDGTTTGWVYRPTNPFLVAASGGEVSGHITYSVPSVGPVGRYTYHGYVGNHGEIYGECEFDFIVPADVPKTGQTTSNATGDDGDLQKGKPWPNPRFTDNGDGTVTDRMTGLIWLKNANCDGEKAWADALTYCNNLASGSCGLSDGSVPGDWRLPNINELESLLHRSFYGPALPNTAGTGQWSEGDPFTNVQSSVYWSATTFAYGTDSAWGVGMIAGGVGNGSKSYFVGYVWPVRAGQ